METHALISFSALMHGISTSAVSQTGLALWIVIAAVFCLRAVQKHLSAAQSDLHTLREVIRRFGQKNSAPLRHVFNTKEGEHIFRSLLSFRSRVREAEERRSQDAEVWTLTRTIDSSTSSGENQLADTVDTLLQQIRPEAVAAAAARYDERTNSVVLDHVTGLPRSRVSAALLTLFEILLSNRSDPDAVDWGYLKQERFPYLNFTCFGIGQSLVVPLRFSKSLRGAIWIGLAKDVGTLSEATRNTLEGLARSAAFLHAFRCSEQTQRETEADRDAILGLSHDIKAPGNSALYSIKNLLEDEFGPLTGRQREHIRNVESCLESLLGLVTDLMNYAKHRKGALEATKCDAPISQIVQSAIKTLGVEAERKHLKLCVENLNDISVHCDPRHAARIIVNLVSNAIKYTEYGSITVRSSLSPTHCEVRVEDTGIGIPAEERERLFTAFQRFGNNHHEQSAGFGLFISNVLAEINNGYLRYTPASAQGSIFTLGLPRAGVSSMPVQREPLSIKQVLLLDDDTTVLHSYARYLRDVAGTVYTADNLTDGKLLVNDKTVDLVITDIKFGREDATSFIQALPLGLPTIVISGSCDSTLRRTLASRVNTLVLEKPADRKDLLDAVCLLFPKRQPQLSTLGLPINGFDLDDGQKRYVS